MAQKRDLIRISALKDLEQDGIDCLALYNCRAGDKATLCHQVGAKANIGKKEREKQCW